MPTILFINGYRFHFYAKDGDEPIHIHVSRGNGYAKIWLEPSLESVYFYNYKAQEQKEIMEIVQKHEQEIKTKWNAYFSK